MKKAIVFAAALSLISEVSFAQKREVPLTRAEKAAISVYDDLPEAYRKPSIELWLSTYREQQALTKGKRKNKASEAKLQAILKNQPPIYRSIWEPDEKGNDSIKKGAWGQLDFEPVNGQRGVYVRQVLSESKFLCSFADNFVIVDGVDVAGVADKTTMSFPGVFEVTGTESYTSAAGAKKTVYVVKPVVKVERDKDDSK